MSKTWPLLVFVILKYCAEKRLLKTHVAFFMKVTVYVKEGGVLQRYHPSIRDSTISKLCCNVTLPFDVHFYFSLLLG
jgi:hypothetical protein